MAKRTQIVCIHEGKKDSVDPVFANAFIKTYDPEWLRPNTTGNVTFRSCGDKGNLRKTFPKELKHCIARGGNTTLIVLADIDHDLETGEQLKNLYWETAQEEGITRDMFEKAIFIFPKDRIENWIQYLETGNTDEHIEGPRIKDKSKVKEIAVKLAKKCRQAQQSATGFPPSLIWSCNNWRALVDRMR